MSSLDYLEVIEAKLASCPTGPGVYLMKDERGAVLYVGKAKSLRPRVRSYFQKQGEHSAKTLHLVQNIRDVEFLQTGSEVEALLLELNLIKKWKPKYNIRLRDDKSYPYVKLDLAHAYPRAYVARKQVKGDKAEYFGPFPNSQVMRQTLHASSKIFQLRDCRDHEFANRSRPCLSFEIGQCTAPCVGYVTAEQYAEQVAQYVRFAHGENEELLSGWRAEMDTAAEALDFEKAGRLRDRIRAVEEGTLGEQRVISTSDMEDRDVWAFWPRLADLRGDAAAHFAQLSMVVVQIRGGKWVGRSIRSADVTDTIGDDDTASDLLLQYYSREPLPATIILPPDTDPSSFEALSPALSEISRKAGLLKTADGTANQTKDGTEDGTENRAETATETALLLSSHRADYARLVELAEQNAKAHFEEGEALRARKEDALGAIAELLGLEAPPLRMECVDISNFQGEANVASCVVFTNGKPDKKEYRHYNIRGVVGQNDFASMKEVMARRYGKPDSPRPDLLVIDGGRGQLSSVETILHELGCDFPVVGLAKARTESDFQSEEVKSSEERIFVPGQKNPLKIRNGEALRTLTHLRDEAHRFAIEFHRKKRSNARGI